MTVRSQLVLAFLLLAVVPLSGIVLFSYLTSQEAFRDAVAAESTVLAEEMRERLANVREDLGRRMAALASLPEQSILSGESAAEPTRVFVDLVARMGDLADLVDWFEFTPLAPGAEAEAERPGPLLFYPSSTLTRALERLLRHVGGLGESGVTEEYLEAMMQQAIERRELLDAGEIRALEARGEEMERLLGTEITSVVHRGEQVLGDLKAMVPASQILRQVLARTPRDRGELPFARDGQGEVHVEEPDDRRMLSEIGMLDSTAADQAGASASSDWLVVETADPESGLTFGIARPIDEPLREIRRTAVRNFGYGLALVVLAMLGVLWLSGRMTRNLGLLTEGAEQIAAGDLKTRVTLRSRDEFGRLALTFNRMAQELQHHQQRLLAEERRRKDDEIQRRLLEAENQRKTRELEQARLFQLSLLPKQVPDFPGLEIAVFMRTAAEVGGDYYDFFCDGRESLTAVIGDAAGHGLRAGTMVTVVKGLLTTEVASSDLPALLGTASRAIKQMNLGRMNMALTVVRIANRRIRLSAAGMPPALVHRHRTSAIEEVALVGMPLGSMADASYQQWESELCRGDTVLLMTDGFPELLDPSGEPLGYRRVGELFRGAVGAAPTRITETLAQTATEWSGDNAPNDDITLLVLRATAGT